MSITLSDGSTAIELNNDLKWTDRFTYSAVEQNTERSLTGALVVDFGVKVSGRPITLASPDANSGWVTGEVVEQCRLWAQTPGLELSLDFHGTDYVVIMRQQDTALEVDHVVYFSDAGPEDYYTMTLRLMDVTP